MRIGKPVQHHLGGVWIFHAVARLRLHADEDVGGAANCTSLMLDFVSPLRWPAGSVGIARADDRRRSADLMGNTGKHVIDRRMVSPAGDRFVLGKTFGCSPEGLKSTGSDGLFYCFAAH